VEYSGQRHWHCQVTRPAKDLVEAKTTHLSVTTEAMASLVVDPVSLTVREARWTVYRQAGDRPVDMPVAAVTGITAHFGCGPALRKALAGFPALAVELFAETVRGVIQAETFLTRERGFASMEDYDDFWKQSQAGSCRYYSNLDRVSRKWAAHVGDQRRPDVLFNRFKAAVWHPLPSGDFFITATLADSFHDAGLTVQTTGPDFTVVRAAGAVRRAPDAVCLEAGEAVGELAGIVLTQADKRTVARALGGPQGCVHLIDLAGDVCRGVAVALAAPEGDGGKTNPAGR